MNYKVFTKNELIEAINYISDYDKLRFDTYLLNLHYKAAEQYIEAQRNTLITAIIDSMPDEEYIRRKAAVDGVIDKTEVKEVTEL